MKERLIKERESVVAQRDNALAVYNQAVGALAAIDMALRIADETPIDGEGDSMSMEQFAEAVGGPGATAEVMANGRDH